MKITVEYKSPEEREAFLGTVSLTMNPPSLDLAVVEASFQKHLELLAQRTYVDGMSRKVVVERSEDFRATAAKFFEE